MLSPLSSVEYLRKNSFDGGLDNSYISSSVSSLTDNDFKEEATSKKTPKTAKKNKKPEAEKLGQQKNIEAPKSSTTGNKKKKTEAKSDTDDEDDGSKSNDLSPSSKKKEEKKFRDKEYAKSYRSAKKDDMKKSVKNAVSVVLDLKLENIRLKEEINALKATIVEEMKAPTVKRVGPRQSRRNKCLNAELPMIQEVQKITFPKPGIMYKLCLFCLHIYHITSHFVYFF